MARWLISLFSLVSFLSLVSLPLRLQAATLPEIEVLALFDDRAMIRIDGNETYMKAGDTHAGVTLVEASSRLATLSFAGETYSLGISERISARFTAAEKQTVVIQVNDKGQYLTAAEINGRPVRVLVDTGANIVAMNSETARSLGVSVEGARQVMTETAGGRVASWEVFLETVAVGGIRAANVRAAVLAGEHPRTVLLGMTFLANVEIRESGGVLQLTTEF